MRVLRLLVSVLPVVVAIIPEDACNNASPSLSQQSPEAESVLVDGSKENAATVACHNNNITSLLTNNSDTTIVVEAITTQDSLGIDFTQHKRSNQITKRKKKKGPKNNSNSTNSTSGDDDSGGGRGITLPISLAVSIVLLVGMLQI
ncbi:hypothetical protein F4859DRAFT_118729 [Xylaria cf. heliscus]|nr:hypothetical protein F4859DRAFT_118729 [Xylaria cf. heliscus]